MKKFNHILFFIWLIFPQLAYSQAEKVSAAYDLYQKGALDEAKADIDAAVIHQETNTDSEAWYLRGFIYKELYKKREKNNPQSPLREEALNSFRKSMEFDNEKEQLDDNLKNLQFFANTYFNDAVEGLKPESYKQSEISFIQYRSLMLELNQAQALFPKEAEYKMALAHLFTKIYEQDRNKNVDYFEKIRMIYEEVLMGNPSHSSANYNLGILYYNKAVFMINDMGYDVDIFELMEIQNQTVDIFKKSLPYMEKAYQLDPEKKETLKGLEGIYFSLNDFEKSNEFKLKLQSLD
jgi:tetratricopeptide (TPR) repeat protein